MRASAAARRYARALFSLAREEGDEDRVRRELEQIAGLFESSPDLENALFRPLHPVAERRAVLRAVCERVGTSGTVRNFLAFLVDQRRLVDFAGIRHEFERLADEAAGRVQAEVVSASPLADGQLERLRRALGSRTGNEVDVQVRVDPELIGGAVAVVRGVVFDGSLRTQLGALRDSLLRNQP
jgi:F-type H+-transporting ATPase subunit delta